MSNLRGGRSDPTKCFYVYIMASDKPVLYIGVTNSVTKRVWQHKEFAKRNPMVPADEEKPID